MYSINGFDYVLWASSWVHVLGENQKKKNAFIF